MKLFRLKGKVANLSTMPSPLVAFDVGAAIIWASNKAKIPFTKGEVAVVYMDGSPRRNNRIRFKVINGGER